MLTRLQGKQDGTLEQVMPVYNKYKVNTERYFNDNNLKYNMYIIQDCMYVINLQNCTI